MRKAVILFVQMSLALVTIGFSISASALSSYHPYPLVVSSEYLTPNGKITMSGSGIVVTDVAADKFGDEIRKGMHKYGWESAVCERCRFFVLTASHVSQGLNTRISVNNKQQEIIGRYADVIRDIEILEVRNNPSLVPQAYYFPKLNGFAAWLFDIHGPDEVSDLIASIQYKAVNVSNGASDTTSYDFVLSPSYRTCDAPKGHLLNEADSHSTNEFSGQLIRNGYGEVVVNAWLPPGFSGSPMFHHLGEGHRLDGIVTEYDRRLRISYLTTQNAIVSIYSAYMKKARGVQKEAGLNWTWADNGLTTFRAGRDDAGALRVRETELIRGAAGSSHSGDGGHGSGGDGGHGSGGDGGHGSGGDGGHGSGGDGGDACGKQKDLTKELTDGLWLDGKQIFAFKRNDGSVIAADIQSYALYRDAIQSSIPWGSELLPFFKQKLPRRLAKDSFLAQDTNKAMWGMSGRPLPLVQYQLGVDTISLSVTDDAYDDSVQVLVNKFGGVGSAPYKRLVDVKSKKGIVYTLDLTGLFVIDFKNTGVENQIMDSAAPFVFIQRGGETARYMVPVVDSGPMPPFDIDHVIGLRIK